MAAPSVIVVGAGIVGVSCALRLQERGHAVTLLDRLEPGEGASYGNAGVLASSSIVPVTVPGLVGKIPKMLLEREGPLYLRWSHVPRMLPWLARYLARCTAQATAETARHMAPLVAESLEEHLALARGTPAERHIRSRAYAFVFRSRAAFESDPFGWGLRSEHGIAWRTVEGDAVREEEPALDPGYRFLAVFDRHHGTIDGPGDYVKALAAAFAARGGRVRRENALALERDGGRITGVRTAAGTLAAERIVVACGAWSARLLASVGVHVPLESERGYHVELEGCSVEPRHALMIADGKFVATPMPGRLRLAGLVEFGGLDAGPSAAPVRTLLSRARRIFPGLRYARHREWLGHRPALADSLPAIGPVPGLDGLFTAFGHHHVGLTSGPRTGRLVADLVSGTRTNLDLSAYAPARFGPPHRSAR